MQHDERREMRDVNIECKLERKPEQHDASIYVNLIEPPPVKQMRDCWTHVQMEDSEKIEMHRQIIELRRPKCTRDVASSVEQIRTFSRSVNTEARATRDSSCGPTFDWHRYSDKSCQAVDFHQQEFTSTLVTQKGIH